MPAFTVIHDSQLKRVITCPADDIENQLGEGESAIDGAYPPRLFELIDNEPSPRETPLPRYKLPNPVRELQSYVQTMAGNGFTAEYLLPEPEQWTKTDAKRAIDMAAGRARYRMASDGIFVDEEYTQAEAAVAAWRAAGSPAENVPGEVTCWAQAKGWTAEAAALDIEYNASGFKWLIAIIRSERLLGKAAVDNAGDEDDFVALAQATIESLDKL